VFAGTAAQSLPRITQSGAGVYVPPPRTGTIAQTLPRLAQLASGFDPDTIGTNPVVSTLVVTTTASATVIVTTALTQQYRTEARL
jgi:hypothetical protein